MSVYIDMEEKIKETLRESRYLPEEGLSFRIWLAIERRERKIARIKLWILSFAGVASLSGAVPASKAAFSRLADSGFYEYASVLFSGGIRYWKELTLSLAGSLPALSMTLLFSLIFVFFLSAWQAGKEIPRARLSF